MLYNIVYSTLTGILVFFIYTLFLTKPLPMYKNIILFLYNFLCVAKLFFNYGQFVALFSVAGSLLLIFLFSPTQKFLNVILSGFGYLFSVLLNHVLLIILDKIFHIDIWILSQGAPILIFTLCFTLFIVLTYTWINKHILKPLSLETLFFNTKYSLFFLCNLGVCLLLFVFNIILGEALHYSTAVIFSNSLLYFFFFICNTILFFFILSVLKKQQKYEVTQTQYKNLQVYTKELEKLYQEMRGFRHDYTNILLSLKTHVDSGQTDSLRAYYYEQILPLHASMAQSDHILGNLSKLEIPEVKSLLSAKLIFAMEKSIDVSLEIPAPVSQCYIKSLDLVRILGILLDNAIEAALETTEKRICLAFVQEEDSLCIYLKNTSLPLAFPISQLSTLGVTSKELHSGTGLFNVHTLLETYPNCHLLTQFQDSWFSQELILTCMEESL